ncbi:MAG: bis(5'-nucleosyl)-tetraphosphatase (symmetrical) YqeK [Candidatus Obscuribacter sp.]|jgi:predicted HD superfamily hydrolase involved in NAD metabolism|nr:bis(5'-nucleosyl)-tetraphosphatase (symmetrical) YqeK [Candidatus Obscuribacter sp.]
MKVIKVTKAKVKKKSATRTAKKAAPKAKVSKSKAVKAKSIEPKAKAKSKAVKPKTAAKIIKAKSKTIKPKALKKAIKPKAKAVKAKIKAIKPKAKAIKPKAKAVKSGASKSKATKSRAKGIPTNITLELAAKWVEPRVTKKRFQHIMGVAAVGKDLAVLADVDPLVVGLACLLHDACKEMKDYELIEKALQYRMPLSPLELISGHLLHGPVAAQLIKRELKITNKEVLCAMAEHTLGATTMSQVSKVVFLADCLEAGRSEDFTKPIWEALGITPGAPVSEINLDRAMLVACDLSLSHLLASRRPIHPRTVDVRNHFLGIVRAAEKSGA